VTLHEFGHIANRDTGKTSFSVELGRCFYVVAAVALVVLDAFAIRRIAIDAANGAALSNILPTAEFFVQMNFKLLLLILLIEVIRSSILRVREFYADARVTTWLGQTEALVSQLEDTEGEQPPRDAPRLLEKGYLMRALRARFTPLHPTARARREALKDPRSLLRPNLRVTFIAGVLTALALNSNIPLLFPLFDTLDPVKFYVERVIEPSNDLALLAIGALLLGLILAMAVLAVTVLALAVAVAPLVGTLGVQVQRAATADALLPKGERLLPPKRLLQLVAAGAGGLLFGSWLTPVGNTVSLKLSALPLIPVLFAGWSFVLLMWAAPLRLISGRALGRHRGYSPPKHKHWWLIVLSAIALAPGVLVMFLSQNALAVVVFGQADSVFPDARAISLIMSISAVSWLSLPFINLVLWVLGAAVFYIAHSLTNRGRDQNWAWRPAPLDLPPLPPLPTAGTASPEPPPL